MLLLRRSMIDPKPETAAAAREEAVRIAPSAPELAFFEHITASVYRMIDRQHSRADWDLALTNGPATWPVLCGLIDQICFFTLVNAWEPGMDQSVQSRVGQLLKTLLRDSLDAAPEGPLEYLAHSAARYLA